MVDQNWFETYSQLPKFCNPVIQILLQSLYLRELYQNYLARFLQYFHLSGSVKLLYAK